MNNYSPMVKGSIVNGCDQRNMKENLFNKSQIVETSSSMGKNTEAYSETMVQIHPCGRYLNERGTD